MRLMVSFFILLLSISCLSPAHSIENESLRSQPTVDGPVEVNITFKVYNITKINEKEENIEFEGAIYLTWMDSRQAYDPAALGLPDNGFVPGDYSKKPQRFYQGAFEVAEMFPGWRPYIELSNGIGSRKIDYTAAGIWPDGMMMYADHFHAAAETPMNLRKYPFDRQELNLYLHQPIYERSEVILVPTDRAIGGWKGNLGVAEWRWLGSEIKERPNNIITPSSRTMVFSELVYTIQLARRPANVLYSIIFPLLLLVSLTWCVFWLDEESVSDRINFTLIGILSVVAYYLVIKDTVPKIPYLTLMDVFMISTFLILAASVIISIVVDKLNRAGRKVVGDRLDRTCRWVFPIGYTVTIALITTIFLTT